MFVDFLYELRRRKVPVGTQEAVALARALERGLHESSLDGFYHVARALLIHSEAHLDAFDQAFLAHEVAYHQAEIDAVQKTLLPAIKNGELKDLVVKVAPAFQAHLVAAQNLEKQLAGR